MGYWIAFDSLSPIGQERNDILNAINCKVIANCLTKGSGSVYDFMPKWGEQEEVIELPFDQWANVFVKQFNGV